MSLFGGNKCLYKNALLTFFSNRLSINERPHSSGNTASRLCLNKRQSLRFGAFSVFYPAQAAQRQRLAFPGRR